MEFLPKLEQACNFIKKETLAQVFSCGFCEISKNTFLHSIPLVAASEELILPFGHLKKLKNQNSEVVVLVNY